MHRCILFVCVCVCVCVCGFVAVVASTEASNCASLPLYNALLSAYLGSLSSLPLSPDNDAHLSSAPASASSLPPRVTWPALVAESVLRRLRALGLQPDLRFIMLTESVLQQQLVASQGKGPQPHMRGLKSDKTLQTQQALLLLRNWLLHYVAAPTSRLVNSTNGTP
jgi:hypothetical protein